MRNRMPFPSGSAAMTRPEALMIPVNIGLSRNIPRRSSARAFPLSPQRKAECAPLPGGALDLDPAAVGLHDMLHDGESEAGPPGVAGAIPVDPVEAFENPGVMLLRNPDPRIRYANDLAVIPLFGRDRNGASGLGVFDRVVDQVYHHLFEPVAVAVGVLPRRNSGREEERNTLPLGRGEDFLAHML